MLTIRVTAFDKKDLPKWMAYEIERYHELGYLDGLMHVKDDEVREALCGTWEMRSYWGTSEEVDVQKESALIKEVKEYLYSSNDIVTLVSIIWDILNEYGRSDIEQFRRDVLGVLQSPDIIRDLLCVLTRWSDRLDE